MGPALSMSSNIVLSTNFWDVVKDCVSASEPLLILLRLVNGDDRPALPEVYAGMDLAKKKISGSFASKPVILRKVLDIVEGRWAEQNEQKLYGAALFLDPRKFYDMRKDDSVYACRLRMVFNDVLGKMIVGDADLVARIGDLAAQYENMQKSFGRGMAIMGQKIMYPYKWWTAYGGTAIELQRFAKRIVGLCCSATLGYERNWSTFEPIHTRTKNPLEYKRLKNLTYVEYNQKLLRRFEKRHGLGINSNPLILEDFQWDNEWVAMGAEEVQERKDLSWAHAIETTNASDMLPDHTVARRMDTEVTDGLDSGNEEDEPFVFDGDVEDDYGPAPPTTTEENGEPIGKKGHMGGFEFDDDSWC